ncbi:hypothetical protein HMI56_001314 [Coelomomyces lativittatus]|nr:hypothetical protein HMI56_001314 [Coelomomyces lativittatus]
MIRANYLFLIAFLFFFPIFTANPIPSSKLIFINEIQIVSKKVHNIIQDGIFYVSLTAFQDEAEAEAYLLQLSNLESTIKHEFNGHRESSKLNHVKEISDLEMLNHFLNIDTFGKLMFDFQKHLYLHLELKKGQNTLQGNKEAFYTQESQRLNLKNSFSFKGTNAYVTTYYWTEHRMRLVFLIMAKNVKILLEKTYPSLKEKIEIDESTPHLIDINFFIQNSKRFINKVLLKSNIENLILEQEYDTLVIPSNLYSNKTSMKKFRDFYNDFYEGNQLEHFQPFLELKLQPPLHGGVTNIYLKLLSNAAPCLRDIELELWNYNSKHQIRKEFPNCISDELLPPTIKKFIKKGDGILNTWETISDHETYLRRAFSRILPWAIILEWLLVGI